MFEAGSRTSLEDDAVGSIPPTCARRGLEAPAPASTQREELRDGPARPARASRGLWGGCLSIFKNSKGVWAASEKHHVSTRPGPSKTYISCGAGGATISKHLLRVSQLLPGGCL